MNELEQKLVSIENKLGGTEQAPETGDKLGWHLDYIESLIGGGSGGDTKLYKHNVMCKDSDNTDKNFQLISDSPNQIQRGTAGGPPHYIIENSNVILVHGSSLALNIYGSDGFIATYKDLITGTNITISEITTDTVTEL